MSAIALFPKRKPEPMIMEKEEMGAFEDLSKAHFDRWIIPLLDFFFTRTGLGGGTFIDVACGPGLLSKGLGERGRGIRVVGVDVSDHALALARKNCRSLSNVSFKKGSVYRLPFVSGSADAVICKDSLHHFDNPSKAIREMLRVTRPGGYVFIQDLRRDLPSYLIKRSIKCRNMIEKLQYYSTRAAYTKREIREMLAKLRIRARYLGTRRATASLIGHYAKRGINPVLLKESFQSRYNLLIRKS